MVEGVALGVLCGLLLWHVVSWHAGGTYARMYQDILAGRVLIAALYNVGLIFALGLVLGLLMQRITRTFGYRVRRIKHFEGDEQGRS